MLHNYSNVDGYLDNSMYKMEIWAKHGAGLKRDYIYKKYSLS